MVGLVSVQWMLANAYDSFATSGVAGTFSAGNVPVIEFTQVSKGNKKLPDETT
jgi:hypothetical protein